MNKKQSSAPIGADYFDYVIWSEDGLTDFRLFILLQEGGEL
jgi:hypothetical protein